MSSAQDRDVCGLTAFLAMLVGRERGGLLEVRARRAHGGMEQRFYPAGCLRGAAAELLALGVRTDVYVGCAPRLRRAGDATAVGRVWTLWVDCDDAAAVGRLAAFTPAPAVVVRSGSGTNVHAYWPLLRPVAPGEAGAANHRLAVALGACTSAVTNPAAILRPPGTHNFKHDPPALVALERLSPARRFVAAHLVGPLPEPPTRGAPTSSSRAVHPASVIDPLLRLAPAVYVQVLTGQAVGPRP